MSPLHRWKTAVFLLALGSPLAGQDLSPDASGSAAPSNGADPAEHSADDALDEPIDDTGLFDDVSDFVLGIEVHGFLSQGYMYTSRNNFIQDSETGSFDLNEFGVNFSADLAEDLRAGIQLLSRDYGRIGDNDIVIDWAYADYRWQDWAGLRVGKIKNVFGLYNETRDIDAVRTWALLPPSVYNEQFREFTIATTGAGLYGTFASDDYGTFSYQGTFGSASIPDDGGIALNLEQGGLFSVSSVNVDHMINGAVLWELPIEGLEIGASVLFSEMDGDQTNRMPLGGGLIPAGTPMTYELEDVLGRVFSARYTWRDLVLVGEYYRQDFDYAAAAPAPFGTLQAGSGDWEGWYLGATYRLNEWFEAGTYYGEFYPDRGDKSGRNTGAAPDHSAWQKDLAVTGRFDLHDAWTWKVEMHWIDGSAGLLALDNPTPSKNYYMFVTKMTFTF